MRFFAWKFKSFMVFWISKITKKTFQFRRQNSKSHFVIPCKNWIFGLKNEFWFIVQELLPCAKTFLAVVHLLDLSWKMRRAASSSFLSSSARWRVAESSVGVLELLGESSLGSTTSVASSSKRHLGLLDLLLDFRRFFFFLRLSDVLEK